MTFPVLTFCLIVLTLGAPAGASERTLEVTATAYNSLPGQTEGDPTLAAWGDELAPGMKAIAVSHDLIPLGLGRGAKVQIDGLPGEWVVLDKMASRWTKKIDLYMGVDREAALRWGIRKVRIRWGAGSVPAASE
jgi:3D (Asp-Asp-Asp) domain-containing protein